MKALDQLLCFIAARNEAVDPVRIMKGLFLFTKDVEQGKLPPQQELFHFEPLGFGPCSTGVYRTLDYLVAHGLVEAIPVSGETWCRFKVTRAGSLRAAQIRQQEPSVEDHLASLRDWCDRQSFQNLLRSVYAAYPDYARNSVLPHLRPNG